MWGEEIRRKRTNPAAKDQVICDKRIGNEEQSEKYSWFNLVTITHSLKSIIKHENTIGRKLTLLILYGFWSSSSILLQEYIQYPIKYSTTMNLW